VNEICKLNVLQLSPLTGELNV